MCQRACFVSVLVSKRFPAKTNGKPKTANKQYHIICRSYRDSFLGMFDFQFFFKAQAVQNAREQTSTASGTACCTSIPRPSSEAEALMALWRKARKKPENSVSSMCPGGAWRKVVKRGETWWNLQLLMKLVNVALALIWGLQQQTRGDQGVEPFFSPWISPLIPFWMKNGRWCLSRSERPPARTEPEAFRSVKSCLLTSVWWPVAVGRDGDCYREQKPPERSLAVVQCGGFLK